MAAWEIIPGESPIDPSGLKIKGIVTRRQLNVVEAENIRKATVKYLAGKPSRRSAPFTLPWLKRLHKEMLGDVWKWAGKFRTSDGYNIGVAFHQIEPCLQNLLDNLEYWLRDNVDFLEQAAMLHHKAVWIHPFPNGNGRWARMLANIWLKLHGQTITVWPEEVIGTTSKIRDDYLTAIRRADDGDYNLLKELHRQFADVPPGRLQTPDQGTAAR